VCECVASSKTILSFNPIRNRMDSFQMPYPKCRNAIWYTLDFQPKVNISFLLLLLLYIFLIGKTSHFLFQYHV
jgi:hypothetical protein